MTASQSGQLPPSPIERAYTSQSPQGRSPRRRSPHREHSYTVCATSTCPESRVIVLSAAHGSATANLNADAFISKPFDVGTLLDTVERLAAP
jgi:hypothetical protein